MILLAIFVPYLLSIRESSNRTRCADHLRQIRNALQAYALENDHNYPSVVHDIESRPLGYTAYTGPDDDDPFSFDPASERDVRPNDVTASLWLLVRLGLVSDAVVFVCPSTSDWRDRIADATGRATEPTRRGNFRSPSNLSYSYASPFSTAPGFRLNSDWLNARFALMADKNPGTRGNGDDVTAPPYDADLATLAQANSNNHGDAGQNVLYPAGNVEFVQTPYCGVDYGERWGDNIYSARAATVTTQPLSLPVYVRGHCGPQFAPAAADDSFLVPTDDDPIPPPIVVPATAPAMTEPQPPPTKPATTTSS